MQPTTSEPTLAQTSVVMKALAHQSRLLIVQSLANGELCVGDLQQIVGSDVSTVSKHLTVLKSAGVVEDRKVGLQVFYHLRITCIADFVHCIGAVMAGLPPRLPEELLRTLTP